MEEIIADLRFQEIHVCLIIRFHTGDIAPVIFQFVSVNLLQILVTDQDICNKIKPVLLHTLLKHLNELSSAKHINTGGNCMGLSHHRFFLEIHDTGFFIHLNNTKPADILCHRYIFAHNGDVRFLLDMIIQYLIIIQFVYAVAACHNNIRFMAALQEINVLCQGIRCPAVPVSVLCRDRRCKNIQATLLTSEIPPFRRVQMLI